MREYAGQYVGQYAEPKKMEKFSIFSDFLDIPFLPFLDDIFIKNMMFLGVQKGLKNY